MIPFPWHPAPADQEHVIPLHDELRRMAHVRLSGLLEFSARLDVCADYGRLVKRERRLLREAYEAAAITPALEHVELLRKAFVSGDPILGPELLASAN